MKKYYRIRKMTPRECGRLMGVDDPDISTMLGCGLSDAALYKMYGNSIVVNVLENIFDSLLVHRSENKNISLWK